MVVAGPVRGAEVDPVGPGAEYFRARARPLHLVSRRRRTGPAPRRGRALRPPRCQTPRISCRICWRRPGGMWKVGSRAPTTSMYMTTSGGPWPGPAVRPRRPPVTAPMTILTAFPGRPAAISPSPTHSRMSGTIAGLAVPPTLTSSAISPATRASRGPQVPISKVSGRATAVVAGRPRRQDKVLTGHPGAVALQ